MFFMKWKSSIKLFLDGIGLNIPIENITGLEDGSPDAKALWVLDKTAQNEPMIDAFSDLSVYGIIAQIVHRKKWGK